MGLGNYLSIRSEKKLYRNYYEKELEETKKSYDYEIQETEQLFQEQGFNTEDSKKLTQIVSKNTDFWVKFMVQYECDMDNPEGDSPLYCGLATFASFVFLDLFHSFLISSILTHQSPLSIHLCLLPVH